MKVKLCCNTNIQVMIEHVLEDIWPDHLGL